MRPLKLTMSAFGPYAHEECIDFTTLKGKNIFLITGPTGAGKTTIFDAISYVLFGEASGSSRDNDSLRSHFALPDALTYIEMEFELKGQVYTIKRYPKQERKKARGDGFTIKESDAELILPDGSLVVKVGAVDEKINSLLGINKNQFRQIVMLPQGEFRKLLEAESKEREVIFRKIFGTEAFQLIQQKLDNFQKEYYRRIRDGETTRAAHVKHLQPGEDEILSKLINADLPNIIEIVARTKDSIAQDESCNKELQEDISAIKLQQEVLQKEIVLAEETNKKLREKDDLAEKYNKELLKETVYNEKQSKMDKGRKTLTVKPVEEALRDREKSLRLKEEQYKETELKLSKANKDVELWTSKLKIEEGKEAEKNNISQTIASLKEKEQKVISYEKAILNIVNLKEELNRKKAGMEKYQLRINSIKEELQRGNKSLLEINSFEVEKVKVAREIDDKNTIVKELRILREKLKQYLENVEEHAKEVHAYEQFENEYIKCKTVYEEMNERFLKGQAGILAESLVYGKECPVCGSTHHPRPADKIEGVPSQKDLNEAKLVYETKLKEKNDRIAKLTDANTKKNGSFNEFEETKDRLQDIVSDNIKVMSPSEVRSYINDKGPKLKAELDELSLKSNKLEKAISEKASIEASIKKYETEIKLSEVEIPKLESDYRETYSFVISEEDQIKRLEIEIPEDIRSSAKLSLKIKELENTLSSLEKAFKEAQDNYNIAVKQYTYLEADKEAKANNVKEGILEVETWKNNLENKIAECGLLSFQDYVVAKMSQDEVELLNSEITEYYKRLQSMKDGLEKSIRDTQGLSSIDIEALKLKATSFKFEEDNLAAKEKVVYSRIKNNKNVLNEINKINLEISKDEERYNVINDISKAANGFNEERITFERYVLAAYFDEIISAANLRLSKMAGGRFVLKRKVEKGKGQKQEGLELEVFDNYTGKSRHVKTLSGGESFKASLALALGLADVVQSYAGGISLDTMFVDEGFGTLDPESLDHAIQCLIDLQNGGRLVGIISHVPELKERINVRLEVTPAKEGSKARFVI